MTLFFLTLVKVSGADGGNTPAWFLISSQKISGVHERPNKGLIKSPFFMDKSLLSDKVLDKRKENIYNVTVLYIRQ